MLRVLIKVAQFLVVLVSILALVILPSSFPPSHGLSLLRGIVSVLIIYLLVGRPVREIVQGFMKGWNGSDDAEPGASPARLDPPDKPRPPAQVALSSPKSEDE